MKKTHKILLISFLLFSAITIIKLLIIQKNIMTEDLIEKNKLTSASIQIVDGTLRKNGVVILINENDDDNYNYLSYRIDKKQDGRWKIISQFNNYALETSDEDTKQTKEIRMNIGWYERCGNLEEGEYRLVLKAEPKDAKESSKKQTRYISVEFTIENNTKI